MGSTSMSHVLIRESGERSETQGPREDPGGAHVKRQAELGAGFFLAREHPGSLAARRELGIDFILGASRRNEPCPYFAFGLLASGTLRQEIIA